MPAQEDLAEPYEKDGEWFLPDGLDMDDLAVGDDAPDFTLESTGGMFTLSERVKDGPVLLYFYVVNYGRTCTNYMALMNETKPALDDLGVTLVHVNPESVENHRAWMRHTESLFEHVSDKGQMVSRSYGAIVENAKTTKILGYTNREFFLIGKEMKVEFVWRAPTPMETLPMEGLVSALKEAADRN